MAVLWIEVVALTLWAVQLAFYGLAVYIMVRRGKRKRGTNEK